MGRHWTEKKGLLSDRSDNLVFQKWEKTGRQKGKKICIKKHRLIILGKWIQRLNSNISRIKETPLKLVG